MARLLLLALLVSVAGLLQSAAVRREAGERARDLSDRLMLFFLRTTSGFADDVPMGIQQEERERRLRWR